MRVMNHAEFIKQPSGTVYARGKKWYFTNLFIKGDTDRANSWHCDELSADAIFNNSDGDRMDKLDLSLADGLSLEMDFNYTGRDSVYDNDSLFAVLEQKDIRKLIERLSECLPNASDQLPPPATSIKAEDVIRRSTESPCSGVGIVGEKSQ